MRFKVSTSKNTNPGKIYDNKTGFTICCYDAEKVCDYLNSIIVPLQKYQCCDCLEFFEETTEHELCPFCHSHKIINTEITND